MARITIDYTPAVHQRAGIGRLTREIVRALLQLPTPHALRLFCMGAPAQSDTQGFSTRLIRSIPLNDRWMYRIWHRARLPLPVQLLSGDCDLYHATDFVLPPVWHGTRTVLTVHDLTFERDPDSAQPRLLSFLKRVVPQSARRATHIVADSVATARDLSELYGISAERITVIHSGVDAVFHADSPADDLQLLRKRYGIGDEPYILTVGTLQRRKNHLTLVRAFAKLIQRLPQTDRMQLVISGGKGWLYDDVLAEVQTLGITQHVVFTGFTDEADLPALYRGASVFAFPSLYEGFGLPPLEAMASGVPVVTSNASSLPEVVGEAGLMVDARDDGALADALERAALDDDWRASAIERGLQRAATFTWQHSAQQLLAVYERVLISR